MARAFKCERCDEFAEGAPGRYKAAHYKNTTFTGGWTGEERLVKAELCPGCADDFEQLVDQFIDGGDE